MKRLKSKLGSIFIAVLCGLVPSLLATTYAGALARAADGERNLRLDNRARSYAVTITNLTYDQIISPPVVVVHDEAFSLFEPGQPASEELAYLAEDGMTGPLAGLLKVSAGVHDYAVAAGGIPPGSSVTVELEIDPRSRMFSLAGMLVSTNDAFVGLTGALPPFLSLRPGGVTLEAAAYDAGSEANTESCDHIPGPPCGMPGERVTAGAEGFVHVHRGLRGGGGLDASAKGWHNPVARITIERARR